MGIGVAGQASLTRQREKQEQDAIDYEMIELLFFAYRAFTSDPDVILEKRGFGRAHHRVLHFVDREPGMTVADLLETLKITKQSLARVLKQLIDSGYIRQVAGPEDRRQRKLYATPEGTALARALAEPQSRRIAEALAAAGPQARPVIGRFLASLRLGENEAAGQSEAREDRNDEDDTDR
ncbi:MarR family transcriptional regulator [Rhizobium sp. CC-YZS058]|uniref:MarR family winged helix-turn-helix transcriptional regulator n=1 Tax=Rhizobium sp. CC-YZS058 TaxID=3042153 RepID=UPI002B05B36F|nr:MarR family transcriptional regulator [Rhizobium sp. CC-YZS058]MEA3534218.1 MarR family transcriptional regulator [Rhizobium sp. CC-YZS058]